VADDASFAPCRMYATHAEGFGRIINVFRERKAAEAWLVYLIDAIWVADSTLHYLVNRPNKLLQPFELVIHDC
jgi:hypothetical protein